MAGRVHVVAYIAPNGSMHLYPDRCPAEPDLPSGQISCMSGTDQKPIRTCPFLYAVENEFEGGLARYGNFEGIGIDAQVHPEYRRTMRVLCLRKESADTPAGSFRPVGKGGT